MIRFLLAAFAFTIAMNVSGQLQDNIKLANEYYQQADYEKAGTLYEKLAKDKRAIPSIHANYFNLLVTGKQFPEAAAYVRKAIKMLPSNYQFRVDLIYLYALTDETSKQKTEFEGLLREVGSNQYQLNFLAQSFVNKELYQYAIDFLETARNLNGRPAAYALDMAAVHRITGDKQSMVDEYLRYALANPNNLNYIKNIFQNLFSEDEDLTFLEQALIRRIQKEPEETTYSELLIWIELQRKNFYAAFVQARALDNRLGAPGDYSMRIGDVAMENKSWNDAIEIFEYMVAQYSNSYNYGRARRKLIQSKEGLVKSQYPINVVAIRELTIDYQKLYDELGPNQITLEALRNKALLHAFHLDEKQIAIKILNEVIAIPRLGADLVARCKLDLGDIYLLLDEPWEASLLYSQVEKANKDSPVAYTAKLRNAKLNYYTGYFSLALGHLNILKQATTREIANDAIALSLLINNNTILDTSDMVMKEYASIELLIFQNKDSVATQKLNALIDENEGHSIIDECYWVLSNVYRRKGEHEQAIAYLDLISTRYGYDILADDAAFHKALILEEHLGDTQTAKNHYRDFLKTFPGSMYAADARKRFRKLRGDQLN